MSSLMIVTRHPVFFITAIASDGQLIWHAPQVIHLSVSVRKADASFILIIPCGQTYVQIAHREHLSLSIVIMNFPKKIS